MLFHLRTNLAFLLLTLLTLQLVEAAPSPPPSSKRPGLVPDEFLIKYRGGGRGGAAIRGQRAFRHEVKRQFDQLGWQHIRIPAGSTREEALARYRQDAEVLAIEPNYTFQLRLSETNTSLVPNDSRLNEQWGLARIGATNAWALTTGHPEVVVAVLDTGVRYTHEDLAANIWRNPGEIPGNGIDDDANGYIDDVHGIDAVNQDSDPIDQPIGFTFHGTACASIIGAVGHNGVGLAGVTWPVKVMPLRLAAASNYIASAWVVECFDYVLAQKNRGANIRVTSNSYGFDDAAGLAVREAINAVGNAGILNVFAAGNSNRNVDLTCDYPACFHLPSVVNVAASDIFDNIPSFSNYGATNVDLAAPGVNIIVADGFETNSYNPNFSGTSAACPHVAGAAALLAAAYPSANVSQIKSALLKSVDLLPAFTNKVASHGRLNLGRAIFEPLLSTNAPPVIHRPPQSQTIGLDYPATLRVVATGAQPTSYYWRFNGGELTQTPAPTLTLPSTRLADGGDYVVVLSNQFGMSTSVVATLTVATTPAILAHPQDIRVLDRSNITLVAAAAGAFPLRYQWQHNLQNLPDATNECLALNNLNHTHTGDYRLMVSNTYGTQITTAARVTVFTRPYIVTPPMSQTVTAGANHSLSLTITNTATLPIGVRWLLNGTSMGVTLLSDQFTAVTNFPNIPTSAGGRWSALVTNEAPTGLSAIMSAPASLTVVVPPTNQTVMAGQNVTFSSQAVGPPTIRYQWQRAGTNLINGTSANLTLNNVLTSDAGRYTLVITNSVGQPATFAATLQVVVPQPVLSQARRSLAGLFEMQITGLINQQPYAVDASSNLVGWIPLTTFTATNAIVPFVDETAGQAQQRCYRARSVP